MKTMKKISIKKRIKFKPSLLSGLIVAIAVPLCAYLRRLFKFSLDVQVSVWELGDPGIEQYFDYDLSFLVNIISMGLILNLIFWIAFKLLHRHVQGKKRDLLLIEFIAVAVILVSAMGVVFHWGFDRANGFYKDQYGMDTSNLYLYLYWGDEYLGHALQETTILGYFMILVWMEQLVEFEKKITLKDIPWVAGIAASLAISTGYAAFKSESAMLMFIVAIIMLTIEIIYIVIKKVNILKKPLLVSTLIGNAAVIVQVSIFIAISGLLPFYPWLRPA